MAYIESAYYGDETSQRDATKSLRDSVVGTTIDKKVDSSLIPVFEVTTKADISDEEAAKIRRDASKACGGVDQACIERTEGQLRQEALDQKQKEANATATSVKGRRLTVNIINERGERQRIIVPENQTFKMSNISPNDPKNGPIQVPSADYIQNQLKLLGGITLSTLVYVFSVVITFVLFMQPDPRFSNSGPNFLLAVPATVIAVFIPYSGFVLVFLYYMFFSAVKTYIGEL